MPLPQQIKFEKTSRGQATRFFFYDGTPSQILEPLSDNESVTMSESNSISWSSSSSSAWSWLWSISRTRLAGSTSWNFGWLGGNHATRSDLISGSNYIFNIITIWEIKTNITLSFCNNKLLVCKEYEKWKLQNFQKINEYYTNEY